ncbi:hypothetical protein [Actinomyces faecalis]|uniref:restriction system modified-DNA reader domain-containing protein n=1 Tax=Actinomyces faecalis TaxID=2722820 RepID=UPI0015558402|nr:hypothetical protein [Actinomyces faecalis]
MTFLQLTQGRLEAVSIGSAADEEAQAAALAAVRGQLVDVLGRPLLPLEWTEVDHGHALTALDPSGQVVTVEVVRSLSPAGLLAALARQQQASSTGRDRLAARYPGGAAAFSQDWNEFREALPVHVEAGPGLIVLTTAVSADVHAGASLLGGSGIEVHLVDVRVLEEAGGGTRLLVGIEQLRTSTVGSGAPLLVARAPRRRTCALAETDAQTASPVTVPAAPATLPAGDPRRAALLASAPTAPSGLTALTGPTAPSAPSPAQEDEPAGALATSLAAARPEESRTGASHRSAAPVLGAEPTVAAGEAAARALAQVAAAVPAPARLVWRSLRRGISHEAVLEPEGRIRVADGRVFTDPSLAASTVQHTQDVDGWRVWRVGQGGPRLGSFLASPTDVRQG